MTNLKSYLNSATVDYYNWLSQFGLLKYEREIVEKYFCYGAQVLDVGCGTGRTTSTLNSLGYRVTGIDYSKAMIKKAHEKFPDLNFSIQNTKNLEFEDGVFDCAFFSFNGLMLVGGYTERKKAFNEIMRVIKKNGVFFFTTPFLDNKVNGEYWKERISKYNKSLSEFSESELISLGDEYTVEGDVDFFIHIPFKQEIKKMIAASDCEIVMDCRRLDLFSEEDIEDELDDNYLWVVKHGNV